MPDKKARYHHGDLRSALLDETTRMIREAGVESVTLRALSERVGVSRAAPYRHFADKTALLCTVAEQGFELLTRELRRAAGAVAQNPRDDFMAQGVAYVNFAVANPADYRLMFSHLLQAEHCTPELKVAADRAYDQLLEAIDRCRSIPGLCRGEPRMLARSAWAMLHGLATLLIDNLIDSDDRDELTRFSLTTLLEGAAVGDP